MGHILIIDREVTGAHPLTEALAHEGHGATTLAQGNDALEWARAHHPDAIVLSVELAGVSGYAICNRLKKDDGLKHIPLLLASSEASQEVFEEHRRLKTRADGYLFKPYDTAAVLSALRHALGQAAATHPAEQPTTADAAAPAPRRAPSGASSLNDGDDAADPLMSTDALLLLEGAVDVNKHTQVIRLPLGGKNEHAKDLIGAALADMDANAMAALTAMEGRVQQLEDALRSQATLLADQKALVAQLTDALARCEARQHRAVSDLSAALRSSMQLCLDAMGDHNKSL